MGSKSGSREWKLRVQDILACIEKIERFTASMTFDQFQQDAKTIDAVIRNFEVIGEAAGYIPLEIQEIYPDIGWLEMRGMRNIMIHEYFSVSLPIIWHTVIHDLPNLYWKMSVLLEN